VFSTQFCRVVRCHHTRQSLGSTVSAYLSISFLLHQSPSQVQHIIVHHSAASLFSLSNYYYGESILNLTNPLDSKLNVHHTAVLCFSSSEHDYRKRKIEYCIHTAYRKSNIEYCMSNTEYRISNIEYCMSQVYRISNIERQKRQ